MLKSVRKAACCILVTMEEVNNISTVLKEFQNERNSDHTMVSVIKPILVLHRNLTRFNMHTALC